MVVLDFPLLAENPREALAATIVVDVDPEIAIERLVGSRGMDADDARARMNSQISRADRLAKATHVFTPKTAFQYGERNFEGQNTGQAYWAAPSPAYGAEIVYRIAPGTQVQGPVRVAVLGPMGDTLRAFANAPNTPGVHRILWDMRGRAAAAATGPSVHLKKPAAWRTIKRGKQKFVGYDTTTTESDLLAFRQTDDRVELVLRQNPFYAESGGQVSDIGSVAGEGWTVEIDAVQIAGEPERKARAEREQSGIWLDDATWGEIVAAGAKVGVGVG